jgi:hypothetical protein
MSKKKKMNKKYNLAPIGPVTPAISTMTKVGPILTVGVNKGASKNKATNLKWMY